MLTTCTDQETIHSIPINDISHNSINYIFTQYNTPQENLKKDLWWHFLHTWGNLNLLRIESARGNNLLAVMIGKSNTRSLLGFISIGNVRTSWQLFEIELLVNGYASVIVFKLNLG